MTGLRALSITLRTVHLAAFALLLGGVAFDAETARLLPAAQLAVASGLGLMATEIRAAGVEWLVMGKGLMCLGKLALLTLVPVFWEQRLAVLFAVVVVASVGSHLPARFRHASLVTLLRAHPGS